MATNSQSFMLSGHITICSQIYGKHLAAIYRGMYRITTVVAVHVHMYIHVGQQRITYTSRMPIDVFLWKSGLVSRHSEINIHYMCGTI